MSSGAIREMLLYLRERYDVEAALAELDALEAALREQHEACCACDRPGNPRVCIWAPLDDVTVAALAGVTDTRDE